MLIKSQVVLEIFLKINIDIVIVLDGWKEISYLIWQISASYLIRVLYKI